MIGAPEVASEDALVLRAALDYVEGWFEGDALRMERALHPELAKRTLDGERLETITARQMIEATEQGVGKRPVDERGIEVILEHLADGIANATVLSAPFVDYLQLARTADGWKIVNVLWQRR
ncbi:MAG TPA: nuclear transport factor 2 family protein [Gaiellaceae bacterium]|nr:nuclear transport factor 2 family protein [Gaiellaceae bacterium]